jgi:hypothetical protein
MKALWIFCALIILCVYVLLGLYITEGIESFPQLILSWVIYTIMCTTFLNVFILGYFWSVVRNKKGPTGIRGPVGENGKIGLEGNCGIDATQAFLIKALNDYIDGLYYSKTNTHILNEDKSKLPCIYLNNKIQVQAGSRQYKVLIANLSKDDKPIINLVNYLKSIWKQWFDMIYDATDQPGAWFIDEFADEEYSWVGTDPFIEIRKYDIYYWGITRNFRPLKAEICRSTLTHNESKIPNPQLKRSKDMQAEPRLKVIKTNDYIYLGDNTSGDHNADTAWLRPKSTKIGNDNYYPVGDIMTYGEYTGGGLLRKTGNTIVGDSQYSTWDYNGPDMKTILVSGDVVDPIKYEVSANPSANSGVLIHKLICPDGYQSLGDVATSYSHRSQSNNKCVPSDCIEEVAKSPRGQTWNRHYDGRYLTWNQYDYYYNWRKVRMDRDWNFNINTLNNWDVGTKDAKPEFGYNLMRVGGQDSFYRLKKSCLVKTPSKEFPDLPSYPPPSTKDVESENADFGIGWNGHPYKLDPKYSIFAFLNLIPEGIIVNQGSGSRFYIIHVEGNDINLFNILMYNINTTNYDGSLHAVDYDPKGSGFKVKPKVTKDDYITPGIINQDEATMNDVVNMNPPKRIEIQKIDKLNPRQQWKIILSEDKKIFKIKNMYKNTYLYASQEPKEGVTDFTTIDIDNDNYKRDPAFASLSKVELENRTNFSFIPSFGTHLNVLDNTNN